MRHLYGVCDRENVRGRMDGLAMQGLSHQAIELCEELDQTRCLAGFVEVVFVRFLVLRSFPIEVLFMRWSFRPARRLLVRCVQ